MANSITNRSSVILIILSFVASMIAVIAFLLNQAETSSAISLPSKTVLQAQQNTKPCLATGDDAETVFASNDATAVRLAVAVAAELSGTVKVAGVCQGVTFRSGTTQTLLIQSPMTIIGGFTTTNWITPNFESPAVLDALRLGRVISTNQPLTLTNLVLQNGFAKYIQYVDESGNGGALKTTNSLQLNRVKVLNSSASLGGGVFGIGDTKITSAWFENNQANGFPGGSSGYGGAVYINNGKSQEVNSSVFISNVAGYGGGLFAANADYVIVKNSLFVHNFDTALYLSPSNSGYQTGAYVYNNTIVGRPNWGGLAIYVWHQRAILRNNTIGGVHTGLDGWATENFNLYFDVTRATTNEYGHILTGTNSFIGNPGFADAKNNDYQLGTSSDAIDRGDNSGPLTDILGNPRPYGAAWDIGAYEYYPPPATSTATSTPTDTPTETSTPTPTDTRTQTSTPTPTPTTTSTETSIPTETATQTPTPTISNSAESTATPTLTPTPTRPSIFIPLIQR